jgi:hypothetical protein
MMTGTGRLRRLALLVAAVGLLVAVGAGVGPAGAADQFRARASAAVSASAAIGSGTGGALDTRVQRGIEVGQGQRTSHHDGVGGPASLGQSPRPWVGALAAILERAGHPERLGQILLRGPPGPSA